jgi:DNA invertase Pin-like site-specific DNA recombinase
MPTLTAAPSAPPTTTTAIGVIRVSQVKGRDGERFASPSEQRAAIEAVCERERLVLVGDPYPEMNVSGGAPLDRRTGLLRAVEAVEAGTANIIVVAYFDRLVRSLAVQVEVLDRVERAGGRILAADVGEVRQDTAARWLSATMLGMVAEYHRRTTAERTAGAQRRAVEQGRPPFPLIPGLRREGDAVVVVEESAPVVAQAVRMRADGATIAAVREHLRSHGIERSYHGTSSLLRSRLLIGEIVFGEHRGSVPAIIDRATWERAQRVSVPRGRKPQSDRLLARLGVLRCGTCGARMVVGSANNRQYPLYRCPPTGDCPRRVTVSAELVEGLVVQRVRHLLAGIEGTATTDAPVTEAAVALDRAQGDLDAAIRAFAGLDAEPAAVERLAALRAARDAARERHDRLASAQTATSVAVTVGDWKRLTLDERRDLIRAVVDWVTVEPGRGADRVTIHDRTE